MKELICYFVDDINKSFVITDINEFAKEYPDLILFSVNTLQAKDKLSKNVQVIESFVHWENYKKLNTFLNSFFLFFSIYLKESFLNKKILPIKQSFGLLISNRFKANEVERHLSKLKKDKHAQIVFYSFWFYDCLYFKFLKKKYPEALFISRAHGGDLYEDRSSLEGRPLFRNSQLLSLNRVFSVSKDGADYLRNKYPKFKDKIYTGHLGTKDNSSLSPFDGKQFCIVSCANVIDIKRIDKIAETMCYINFPITWVHFGDENLEANNELSIPKYLKYKKQLMDKPEANFIAKGTCPNELIHEFYKNNPVNLFLSLSLTEGLPVSMMEAISYGIPVMSTDVGGCKEIVNYRTGVLLPPEIDAPDVAKAIEGFKDSEKNSVSFRRGVHLFWKENYNRESNYVEFFKKIKREVILS